MKVIWDLDNCLSDDAWRIRMINRHHSHPHARYVDYHSACGYDRTFAPTAELFMSWRARGASPVFVTGRPDWVRTQTLRWLELWFGEKSPTLLMRPYDDHRKSAEVKHDLLLDAPWLGEVCMAYDDHPDVVKMYATRLKLPTMELKINDHNIYYGEQAS